MVFFICRLSLYRNLPEERKIRLDFAEVSGGYTILTHHIRNLNESTSYNFSVQVKTYDRVLKEHVFTKSTAAYQCNREF